jgi:hypothetical protein
MLQPEHLLCGASQSEAAFGLKFWADFAKDSVAAIAGAGVGALLGARYAFGLERRKATAEHDAAARSAALDLAERRAMAGNLAVFTLAQIYNDLVAYERQLLSPAIRSNAPWFWLAPTGSAERNVYRFDVPNLAFLLQSEQPGAPLMLMRLALEQDRYAAFLDTLQHRAVFHQQSIPPIIERLQREHGNERKYTDAELQQAVGPRIYAQLRNYYSDIETLLRLGVESSGTTGNELRALLVKVLPGQTIIGFEAAEAPSAGGGSPLMHARNKAAESPPKA